MEKKVALHLEWDVFTCSAVYMLTLISGVSIGCRRTVNLKWGFIFYKKYLCLNHGIL